MHSFEEVMKIKCVGVGILTSNKWEVIEEEIIPGRLLMAKLKKEQTIKVFCVYDPNIKEERKKLYSCFYWVQNQ